MLFVKIRSLYHQSRLAEPNVNFFPSSILPLKQQKYRPSQIIQLRFEFYANFLEFHCLLDADFFSNNSKDLAFFMLVFFFSALLNL